MTALHIELINRVNEVGVDINKAFAHVHWNTQLQFVGGLGPRKAGDILKVGEFVFLAFTKVLNGMLYEFMHCCIPVCCVQMRHVLLCIVLCLPSTSCLLSWFTLAEEKGRVDPESVPAYHLTWHGAEGLP